MKLFRLNNKEIDKTKWNDVVLHSSKPDIYALSWFMDSVNPQWQGLVLDDYSAVMPLPVKKRFGLPYLVQPVLSQRYDIYSKKEITNTELILFKRAVRNFISVRISLSKALFGNERERCNFELDLNKSYEEITSGYTENTLRNISKAVSSELLCKSLNGEEGLEALKTIYEQNGKEIEYFDCISSLIRLGQTETYAVYDDSSELCAVAVFFKMQNKLYYLLPASTAKGKELRAMFFLIDCVIRNYAWTDKTIDFEGSEIPGIYRFYAGFGAVNQPYYFYSKHRLPFLGKFVK